MRSNWRGPVWVNANAMLAYGLNSYGFKDEALKVNVVSVDYQVAYEWECA